MTEAIGWVLTPQRVFKIHQQAQSMGLSPARSVSCVPAPGGGEISKGACSALCREKKRKSEPQKGSRLAQVPGKNETGLVLPPPQGTSNTNMLWEGRKAHQAMESSELFQEMLCKGRP